MLNLCAFFSLPFSPFSLVDSIVARKNNINLYRLLVLFRSFAFSTFDDDAASCGCYWMPLAHAHLLHFLQITWIDGLENVLTEGVEYVKEPSASDTRRFTAKSILKLKANKDYHNKTIICQAQNSVDKTYRSAAIRLDVRCIYTKIM